ncbi:MFS transporter [Occallatibacter riparius]|uniref:MFS transporter n=1 Tax=Occallatibacter riparius TaxID=1002689 RepID=A0A9J7BR82_9BACT|nr:MFS transporter [Occallatibacter riparius]UWZ85184.1 MFS transporter [Occallatibacter riparius]
MSVTAISAAAGSPERKPASPFPADLSHSPLLGILGVLLGAAIVTLTGRLLSLGLADLKGNVGISYDEGAWVGSAFNVALMFIGPFSVYLGGLFGARRVLLAGASIFTVVSASLPQVHSYSLLIVLLAVAGLTSGTFYPLTLTFALRNIPLRYLALVLALYAFFIEGAVNCAPSIYGFFRNHLSWEWMFWLPALATPAMMACVYFGIPESPMPQSKKEAPSFAGFLYLSAGFALLFAALDQGQRLDWWRSGLFNGLFAGSAVLLLFSLERRLRVPNFLVDLGYLRNWNTILLGFALFSFRLVLLATIIIIPQSLSVRGLDAEQYGPAVFWTAVLEIALAFVGALLLYKGIDSRLLMAIGFTAIAFACVLNANFTSAWSAESYFPTELLMGVGQSFALLGLISSIILQVAFSGGLEAPQRALTVSAFFHSVRLLGGQVGVALMGHFIAEREKLHSNLLGLHVQSGNWLVDGTLHGLAAGLAGRSNGAFGAAGRAVGVIDSRLRLQAYSLAFIDAFHIVVAACVVMLVFTAALRRSPMNFRQLPALQQGADSPQEARP